MTDSDLVFTMDMVDGDILTWYLLCICKRTNVCCLWYTPGVELKAHFDHLRNDITVEFRDAAAPDDNGFKVTMHKDTRYIDVMCSCSVDTIPPISVNFLGEVLFN